MGAPPPPSVSSICRALPQRDNKDSVQVAGGSPLRSGDNFKHSTIRREQNSAAPLLCFSLPLDGNETFMCHLECIMYSLCSEDVNKLFKIPVPRRRPFSDKARFHRGPTFKISRKGKIGRMCDLKIESLNKRAGLLCLQNIYSWILWKEIGEFSGYVWKKQRWVNCKKK